MDLPKANTARLPVKATTVREHPFGNYGYAGMKGHLMWVPYSWATILTLLVAGRWLVPGYLFGTDWPGPRHFTLPTDFPSSALLRLLLVVVSAAVSAEITTKLVILVALFVGALGAFRTLPLGGFIPRAM